MFLRLLNPPRHSFFLFGPRGVGKSTWIDKQFIKDMPAQSVVVINLLHSHAERKYRKNPELLAEEVEAMNPKPKWIILDEVQKVPALLDLVHLLIEKYKISFLLSGSSARKLKRGAANLLAGRAFLEAMFPLTHIEMGRSFKLHERLEWGGLPKVYDFEGTTDRVEFLASYATTYLKEEILQELIVRKVEPFESFLGIAAQMDGKYINYAKIAKDAGVDPKTIRAFYQILEDTLLGFRLPGYHASARKRQRMMPKFYFFDLGVRRQLDETLDVRLREGTSEWGRAFEAFIIQEVRALNSYSKKRYNLFSWSDETREVDLILKRGETLILIEIKSGVEVTDKEIDRLAKINMEIFPGSKAYIFSNEKVCRKRGSVVLFPWREGMRELFA